MPNPDIVSCQYLGTDLSKYHQSGNDSKAVAVRDMIRVETLDVPNDSLIVVVVLVVVVLVGGGGENRGSKCLVATSPNAPRAVCVAVPRLSFQSEVPFQSKSFVRQSRPLANYWWPAIFREDILPDHAISPWIQHDPGPFVTTATTIDAGHHRVVFLAFGSRRERNVSECLVYW